MKDKLSITEMNFSFLKKGEGVEKYNLSSFSCIMLYMEHLQEIKEHILFFLSPFNCWKREQEKLTFKSFQNENVLSKESML